MEKKVLPVIPSDRVDDLHNLEVADDADLVLFMAGNQFMAMGEIIRAFQAAHPEVQKIFYETLPPGLALKQIMAERGFKRFDLSRDRALRDVERARRRGQRSAARYRTEKAEVMQIQCRHNSIL